VQTPDQIRTVARTLRDNWQRDHFPQRQELPKALVFAKGDNRAETIVQILREEFGRGNEFAQKITYRTTGAKPEDLIKAARTSYSPRIAVTVDTVATGTDIKPVQIVVSTYLDDPTFADAILDRIVHSSHKIELKGKSLRDHKEDQ
jgi:type I restriction enzyme R subunit